MEKTKLFLNGFVHGFGVIGRIVAEIINLVLLCVIYFVGVGTATLLTKISGTKLICLNNKSAKSYYKTQKIGKEKLEECYKQF